MLRRIVDFHLDHPWAAVLELVVLVVGGVFAATRISIDAFPDLTNNQVTVLTEALGMGAPDVEQLVTFPIESAMLGLPDTQEVRSTSRLGLSMVTIVFADSVDVYFARQLVTERLNEVRGRIPQDIEPVLGPVATVFGEVFRYTVEGGGFSTLALKTLHDWDIKYQLRAVPGVADIATWGGHSQQFEIEVDLNRLRAHGLGLREVFERVRDNNEDFGAGFVEHASEQYTVRGLGRVRSVADLASIVLTAREGTAVYLRDVAEIKIGAKQRQGAVTRDAKGEVVSGTVIMLKGQNSKSTIERVKQALEGIRRSLPEGVRILPFYDQSEVIDGTIRTVRNNLIQGGALVIAVLLLFLGNVRAALIVASVIPLSMLAAFLGMRQFGITANLMSLGAIDFGMIVDGAVIMVENQVRHLHGRSDSGRALTKRQGMALVRSAAHEVSLPILVGVGIITAVYVPVLTLEGLEGRMYRPLALTVCAALLGALALTLAAVPTASRLLLAGGVRLGGEKYMERARAFYRGVVNHTLDHRGIVIVTALVLVGTALGSLAFIGTEFMPRLDEGSVLVQTLRIPSIALSESVDIGAEVEERLLRFPEVTRVVATLGRPDLATEAMGIYESDVYVNLKPRGEWTTADTKEGLTSAMADELSKIPGVVYNFTQPMAMRLDESISGVRADVAVKIFGSDASVLDRTADEVLRILGQVRGAADAQKQVSSGTPEWQVVVDREEAARYGLNVSDVRDVVQAAVRGKTVTEVIDGRRRIPVTVRLPEAYRTDSESLASILLTAPAGEQVPLGRVAEIRRASGPQVIDRENSERRIIVQCNVRGRDLGTFVSEARRRVEAAVSLPSGYYLDWSGQFEDQQRAMRQLAFVVPAVLAVIFCLLLLMFRSAKQSLLVLLIVPFATVGGIGALWLRGMNLNVSASIGFIAVFGVAVLDGLVMVSTMNALRGEGRPLREAVVEGAVTRLRPVLMTSVLASLGFLPMAIATSTGAEVQRPLATVVIGGLASSTILTLVLLPTLYGWFLPRSRMPEEA
ncbi:MAG: CusA/CzcA family heavy metal efflux RND transporter [Bryobacterales bacterium]|nr:CusA/CzcA family heavy metal efflux RND transporter [Bryobacterales bacterium]